MKISVGSMGISLMFLSLFNLSILTQRQNNLIHLIMIAVLILWAASKKQSTRRFWSFQIERLFALSIILSTVLMCGVSSRAATAVTTALTYYTYFWVCSIWSENHSYQSIGVILLRCVFLFTLFVDGLILVTNAKGIGMSSYIASYLIGNKFTVSYLHMLLIALVAAEKKEKSSEQNNQFRFIIVVAWSIFICIKAGCMTGTIGCVTVSILCMLSIWREKIGRVLSNPMVYCSFMILISLVVLNSARILENSIASNLIVDILHRSVTLTGRTETFQAALEGVSKSPILGYGINSTYVEDVLTWGNAQNGLLKMMLDFGILGTILFILVCVDCFSNRKNEHSSMEYAMMAFLYGMAVCGTVEVCFSRIFFLGLALLKMTKMKQVNQSSGEKD